MTKPTYRYPHFVSNVELKSTTGKRYWLSFDIDTNKTEEILIILKNPSRANNVISDKTVYNVSNFIYRNRGNYPELKDIGRITILNLMPHYLTDSTGLQHLKDGIIDQENLSILNRFCTRTKKVIIAWGNHPKGLLNEYEELKAETKQILQKHNNEVYYVNRLTNAGNPTHGQIWAYNNPLFKFST